MPPIVDLHSDLLSFLVDNPRKGTNDPTSKASYPLMKKGGMTLQVLPIFTETKKGSQLQGEKQLSMFHHLLDNESNRYCLWDGSSLEKKKGDEVFVLLAIENGSGFLEEDEPMQKGLDRLENMNPLYISLTWDGENRFGGGNESKAALKKDGETILEYLHNKKVAIDLSHTSDFLADGILNHLDKKSLNIPVIASHSNARIIEDKKRNLPDFLIKEILRRKGLIGLNFFSPFIGDNVEKLVQHTAHILELGGENSLCFGADFFPTLGFEYIIKKYGMKTSFFPELNDASCYPFLLELFNKKLNLPKQTLSKICHQNFEHFTQATRVIPPPG
jgi:membrane dipeptidase